MLYLGIPEYRLPRSIVEAQVREILETGDITLKLNAVAGRDFAISELRSGGFDAVLIAVGAHKSRDLSIPGVDLDGVHRGVEFLLNVNLGYKFTIGKKVVVIGGGNVAMDVARSAAREVLRQHEVPGDLAPSDENVAAVAAHEMVDISLSALRMGAREVGLVCLEQRDEMPAALEEIEEAETEGILMHPGFGPKRVVGREGRVVGLECLKTKYVFDANRRFNPAFYENSETVFDCDTVILAIGQAPNLDFIKPEDGVQISPRGLVYVNRDTLMTSAPGVFAGGDCAFGPRLIIDSVGDGKRAAVGIDEYLRGHKRAEPQVQIEILDRWQMAADYMNAQRQAIPMLPLDRRTGMTEVELPYNQQEAMAEAQRCLKCYINTILEGSEADGSDCILCGGCVDVCPENCLELIPLDRISFDSVALDAIANDRDAYEFELKSIQPEELGSVTGTAMVKDETRCIRCGLCALRCPANTITMEAYHLVPTEPTGLITIQSFDDQNNPRPELRR
jgi:NADPH-dependent glutamate synthase beta subunit-like oxidoreductase/NAD-dependent dihydropyrimidine dehydrogenase PreA subunit